MDQYPVMATIPVSDTATARQFYGEILGLKQEGEEMPGGVSIFQAGDGTWLSIYARSGKPAAHTLATFTVDDIYETVHKMTGRGVKFLEYNEEPIVTDESYVASMGDAKAVWFEDPDGNILSLTQFP